MTLRGPIGLQHHHLHRRGEEYRPVPCPPASFCAPIPRLAASEQTLLITTPLCFDATGPPCCEWATLLGHDWSGRSRPKAGVCAWLIPQVGPLKRPAARRWLSDRNGGLPRIERVDEGPGLGGQGPARPPEPARYPPADGSTHNAAKKSRHSAPLSAATRKPLDYEHNGGRDCYPPLPGPSPVRHPPAGASSAFQPGAPVFLWHPHRPWSRGRGSCPTKQITGSIGTLFLPKLVPQCGGHWQTRVRAVLGWSARQEGRRRTERQNLLDLPSPLRNRANALIFVSSTPGPAFSGKTRR